MGVTALTGLAGCDRGSSAPGLLAPAWREVTLPQSDGRIQLGDITACSDRWYAVGAVLPLAASASVPVHRAGEPGGFAEPGRPAIWSSMDGLTWTVLPTKPISAYGPFNRLYSVACGAGHVAAIGAVAGGAHGNPRTSTWVADLAGSPLSEVDAPFDRYGGPDAIGVNQVSGGRAGFLIAGNRMAPGGMAGAAVWTSPDAAEFTLLDNDPALRSGADAQTTAAAGTALGSGWLLAGSLLRPGSAGAARDPVAWSSPDGAHWIREQVPGTNADDALDIVVDRPTGAMAVGVRNGHFAAWLRSAEPASGATRWRAGGEFDNLAGSAVPLPTAITGTRRSVFVAVCNGTEYRVWVTADGARWREVRVPVRVSAGPQRRLLVAAEGDRLLLAADDGTRVRMWLATEPG